MKASMNRFIAEIEIVFMGIGLNQADLEMQLRACLVDFNERHPVRNPTEQGLGIIHYRYAGFESLYQVMGEERRYALTTLRKEVSRLDQVRARLEHLSHLERDLTSEEITEARALADEYRSLRG